MDLVQEASADELRAVVLALCKDTSVEIKVTAHINKLRKLNKAEAKASKTGEKRKASPQSFICVRCGEAFAEESNNSKACTYHHGELELEDEDLEGFWADHDERSNGPIDTDENREQYPQGFTWDCCGEAGTATGCTKGHHYAIEGKRMKTNSDADSVSDNPDR